MIFIESSFCASTRTLLTLVGIWPYYMSPGILIKRFLIFLLLASGVAIQLNALATREFSMVLLLKILSYTILKIIYLVKYITFLFCADKIKEVLKAIQLDLDNLTDEDELKIIEKCYINGKRIAVSFGAFCYPPLVAFVLTPLLPDVLDLVAPLNETRAHKLPIIAEYFVDENDFIYPIIVHIIFIDIIGVTVIISTESTFVFCVLHSCGLFRIACKRIEYAFQDWPKDSINEKTMILRVIHAVNMHKRALQFIDALDSYFMPFYFVLLCLGICSLSINLYILTQILQIRDMDELVVRPGFVICHFFYLALTNYLGQMVIDSGNSFFIKICNSHWYAASHQIRKLLPFILQKSAKEVSFGLGGFFTPSLEGLSTLTSMSLSYFTVIYSST